MAEGFSDQKLSEIKNVMADVFINQVCTVLPYNEENNGLITVILPNGQYWFEAIKERLFTLDHFFPTRIRKLVEKFASFFLPV